MPGLIVALILSGRIFTAQANLTWYDPALGGINCDHDCTTVGFSTPVARNYGSLLACPIEFPRGTVFIIRNSWRGLADGWWTCWDAGGRVVINPDGTFQLDLMSHYPIWKETLEVEVRVPGALGPPIGPNQLLGELERVEVPLSICIPKQAKRVQEDFLDSLLS